MLLLVVTRDERIIFVARLVKNELKVAQLQRGRLLISTYHTLLCILAGLEHLLHVPQIPVQPVLILRQRPILQLILLLRSAHFIQASIVLQQALPQHIESLLSCPCLFILNISLVRSRCLHLRIAQHLLALLIEHQLVLVPILAHHLVKLVNGQVRNLLL